MICFNNINLATAMGTAINAQENVGTVFYESVEALCRLAFERFFSNFKRHDFFYSFTADYQKEKRALKVVQEYAASVLKSRKQALMQNFEDIDLEERKTKSFLDILLEYKLKNQVLSDQDILDEVNTFMFGVSKIITVDLCLKIVVLMKHNYILSCKIINCFAF